MRKRIDPEIMELLRSLRRTELRTIALCEPTRMTPREVVSTSSKDLMKAVHKASVGKKPHEFLLHILAGATEHAVMIARYDSKLEYLQQKKNEMQRAHRKKIRELRKKLKEAVDQNKRNK